MNTRKSMSVTHPEFLSIWHPTKNNVFTPDDISAGSSKKVWWLCEKGHEWEAVISNITRRKSGCPYCSNRKVLAGYNDLMTKRPIIAQKWHPTKNGDLTAQRVSVGSSRKVWWLCGKGHEWEAHINIQTDTSCPYCYGRYVIPGENDLATLYPTSVKEWHPVKNRNRTPQQTMPYTPKRVWWICQEAHEWEASPNSRFGKGDYTGCPYCANKKVLLGFNDLVTTHPQIAETWHPTKNGKTTPEVIMSGNETLFWWLCDNQNHEWQAGVYSRAVMGTGCPVCSGKRVDIGVTDLLTLNPSLAAQWHPTKNGDLLPSQVAAFSSLKVWWKCAKGHEWEALIAGRHQGRKCARCNSGEKASKAEKEISQYVLSLGEKAEFHTRKILKGKELDIYIPAKKVAIEFNGVYWHTEGSGKGSSYHYDKWQDCKALGVDLIQVWEDDWNRNPQAIKQFIAYKLGHGKSTTARPSNSVYEITVDVAHSFLNDNHINGSDISSHYLGVNACDGSLLAVVALQLDASGKCMQLKRFVAREAHVSCLAILLAYANTTYNVTQYRVLDDHSYSESELWEACGFRVYAAIPPDFTFLHKKRRAAKNELSNTEVKELARIWDAGKTIYVK